MRCQYLITFVLLGGLATLASAQSCTSTDLLADSRGCIYDTDKTIPIATVFCDYYTTSAAGVTGLSFKSPTTDTYIISNCHQQSGVYNFSVPHSIKNSMKHIFTLAAYEPGTPSYTESTIRLVTTDGDRISIGTLIAGVNTAIQPEVVDQNSQGTMTSLAAEVTTVGYPHNGAAVCNGKLSYQQWDVAALLKSYTGGIDMLEVIDTSHHLKFHAVSGSSCAYTTPTPVSGSHSRAAVKAGTFATSNFLSSGVVNSWADCAKSCSANSLCDDYNFIQSTTLCTLTTKESMATSPDTSVTTTGVGTWNIRGGKSLPRGTYYFSQRNETTQQFVKKSQCARFASNRRYFYKVLTTSDKATYVKQPLKNVFVYTIGVAQSNFASSAVSSWLTGGPVSQCGGLNTTTSDYFSNNENGATDQCDKYLYCPSFYSTAEYPLVDLQVMLPPIATGTSPCTGSDQTTMKHGLFIVTDGVVAQAQTYYYYTTATVDAAVIAEVHSLATSSVTLLPLSTLENQPLEYQRYSLSGVSTQSAPDWHWRDGEGAERSTKLVCEVKSLLGYVLTHNISHGSGAYSCSTYQSLFAIAAACDADDTCTGYSTRVDPATSEEVPDCLTTGTTMNTTEDSAATFYEKQPNTLTCSFPVQYATEGVISITNAMPGATYTVAVDGVTTGTCSASALATTATASDPEASCNTFVTCYSGAITSTGTTLTVTMKATGPYNQQCPMYLFAARADFSLTTAVYSPTSACTTAYSFATLATSSSACSPTASTQTRCAAQSSFSITVPTTYCSATDANGIWVTASTKNTYHVATMIDFSSLASTTSSTAAWFSVVADLTAGGSYHLGYVSTSSLGIRYVPRHRSGRSSTGICSGTSTTTNPVQNTQVFPVPTSLRDKISVIRVRGLQGRVIGGAAITCSSFITPRQATDRAFKAILPGVRLGSPTYGYRTATDFAACGALCGADSTCFAFTFSSGSCELKAGTGVVPSEYQLTSGTASSLVSGVATHLMTEQSIDLAGHTAQDAANFITAMSGANAVVMFLLPQSGSPGSAQVMISNAQHFGVTIYQTGFQGTQVAITSSGGSLICGSNFEPFATAQSSGGCTSSNLALAGCPVRTDTKVWSGSINIKPFYDANTDLSGCDYPLMGYVHSNDGTFHTGIETLSVSLVSSSAVASTVSSLGATGNHVEMNANITLDGTDTSIIGYKSRTDSVPQDPGAAAGATTGSGAFVCNLRSKIQFDVFPGKNVGIDSTAYNKGAYSSIQAAAAACTTDPKCVGFSTTAGLFTAMTTSVVTGTTTGSNAFYLKRETTTCNFTIAAGHFKLSLAENTLFDYTHIATIKLDGVLVRQCGGVEKFQSGYSTGASRCNSYLTCVDEALTPVDRYGVLTVEFPAQAVADQCGSYGSALLQYTASPSSSVNYMKAVATLNQRRTIHWGNRDNLGGWVFRGQDITTVQVVLEQDRWDCGVCSYQYAMNLSVGGTLARGCGGALGFSEGRGLSDQCNTMYHCGPVSTSNKGVSPSTVTETTGYSATLSFASDAEAQALDTASNACDSFFTGTLYSDGILYSAQAGSHSTRMRYAERVDMSNYTSFVANGTVTNSQKSLWGSSAPTFLKKEFSVTENFQSVPGFGFAVYDVDYDPLLRRMDTGDTMACIVDDFSDETAVPGCFVTVDTNWLYVRVEQTAMNQNEQTVTISGSNFTTTCGGDALFFGFTGTTRCGTYYMCYNGPVAPGDRIRISFSKAVILDPLAETCNARAVALLDAEQRLSTATVVCSGDTPFTCVPQSSCLPVSDLCDKTKNCVDDSDESGCNNWNYVMDNVVPTCDPIFNISLKGSMSAAECQRYGIAYGATSTVVGGDLCMVYKCLIFTAPNFITIHKELTLNSKNDPGTAAARRQTVSTSTFSRLYISTNDPTSFKYCTSALHCNGNGVVQSTQAPCQCSCDTAYVGATCESVRDISLIDKFIVVVNPNVTFTAGILQVIVAKVTSTLASIEDDVVPTVESVEVTPSGRSISMSIAHRTGQATNAVYVLLSPNVRKQLVADLQDAGTHTLYITASSVVGTSVNTQCRRTNITGTDNVTCVHYTNINVTKSVQVTIPGVSLTGVDQWVEVDLLDAAALVTATLRCEYHDFTQAADPTKKDAGACGYASRCTVSAGGVVAKQIVVRTSPNINPDNVNCEGFVLDMTVNVEGTVTLPTEDHATVSSSERVFDDKFLYIAFGLWGVAALCFILLMIWFRARNDFEIFKYAGPILAGGVFFCSFFGVCLWAIYVGSGVDSYTHFLIIEEYRDYLCSTSEHSFIPHRVSFVPADGNCHQIATIGSAEGIIYMSAVVTSSNQPAQVRIGASEETCKADPMTESYNRLSTQQCLNESTYFSKKTQLERHFIYALALQTSDKVARIAAIQGFNPPVTLNSATQVAELPSQLEYPSRPRKHLQFISGKEVPVESPNWQLPDEHFLIYEEPDVPLAVVNNESHDERVIFKGTITHERTLFAAPRTVNVVEGPPIKQQVPSETIVQNPDGSNKTIYGSSNVWMNYGKYFNNFKKESARTGAAASQDAVHFQVGLNHNSSILDMGALGDFTLTFWMAADRDSRGFVYAMVDNWVDSNSASPILNRLLEVIENTDSTTPWFGETWNVYSSIYVNGLANSIYFVWATPETGVVQLRWDTSIPGVNADRLFDGGWHMVSIVFEKSLDRSEAQLFVDGETHFAREGWRKCLPSPIPDLVRRNKGDNVNVLNRREETVEEGWLLLFGYVNGGVYDFVFHPLSIPREKLISYATPGMALYSTLTANESLVLAAFLIFFTFVGMVRSAYEVYQFYFGFEEVDDDDDVDKMDTEARAAHDHEQANALNTASTARSAQYWQFVNPVMTVGQLQALYIGGWDWPPEYENFFGSFFSLVSFDLAKVVANFPVLLPAAIQFFAAMIILFAILWLAIKDSEGFDKIVENYRESKKERVKHFKAYNDDRPKPSYKWIVWISNDESQDLTPNQESVLLSNLTDMLTSRHKRDANMRLHTKTIVSLDELGSGIILYERVHGNVFVTFRAEAERDADTGNVSLTLFSLEAVASNTHCPQHERRLINIDTNLSCIHENNMLYRAMTCTREGQYYKCPDEMCEYAICEQCYFHGAEGGGVVSGAVSGALAKLHELRQLGLAATLGTLVVLLAAVVYLPVVKNAMMVMFCHPTYQCEFGTCQTPTTLLIIATMMAYITVVFIGIGIIAIETVLLRNRHTAMVKIIPMKKVRRKYNCRLLPQNIPTRRDFEQFLKHDNSMLLSLYEPFEFQYFWMAPVQLLFKGLSIVALVIFEPNSLSQLAAVCFIEVLSFLTLMLLSPYKNAFVEFVARLGSFHQLIELGMMALHRVEIRDDPDADGYGEQMVWCSMLFMVLVLLTIVAVVVVPAIQNWREQKERLARGTKGSDDKEAV